jgi:hypothetical protein
VAGFVLVLMIAFLALLNGCSTTHRAGCPPVNGLRGSVCGDVDGRPGLERVGIDRRGSAIWLVVRFAHHSVATRLATEDSVDYSLAGVNGLAALDRAPGLEIVVTVHHGASTAFGELFRVENGALARIRIPGFGGEFAYEGSVTHFNVIDCARPQSGLIWISGYGLDDSSHYIQERTLYRLAGDRLAQVRHESSRVSVPTAGRFPEFAEPQPFPHCLVVRNSRIQ